MTTYRKRYDPATHDIMLFNKWKKGLDDYEIFADFQRQGLDFPLFVLQQARQRLELKPNKNHELVYEKGGRMATERVDALAVAQETLPGFDRTTMTLDGRTIKLEEAMKRTNRILKAEGKPQVCHNPEWVQ